VASHVCIASLPVNLQLNPLANSQSCRRLHPMDDDGVNLNRRGGNFRVTQMKEAATLVLHINDPLTVNVTFIPFLSPDSA
jgi:hypothetical protein